jgi:hypothetical protein
MTRTRLLHFTAALVAVTALLPSAHARDEQLLFGIDEALASPAGKDRFDDTVQFFWGDRPYPEPVQSFGIFTSERKTFAPTQTDSGACEKAFIETLATLRDRAKEVGGNAVVDIKSIYKNREFRSDTQYECRAGYVVTGVSLEGRIVKLPEPGVSAIRPGQ